MLARISQFNEELTRRVEEATKELAQRNEELRIANESLFQAQRKLVQAEKLSALGHMAATMAHEIGTPLNSISGYIQLMLMEGNHSEVMTRRLKIIESQLDRLTQTIRNLLNSTRQPAPKLEPLDINQVLEEVINLTQPGLTSRGILLVREMTAGLPYIQGDPMLLQQVFLNLINNALDAMSTGGTLTIGTKITSLSEEARYIEVVVADTGVGMSEEVRKKATEPFFTTKEPGKGAGLGLAICDEIIRSHGGKLLVESALGKGSTMRVMLPITSTEEV
jgi:signal transduction histidine kinase